jgi:hypothetical protein
MSHNVAKAAIANTMRAPACLSFCLDQLVPLLQGLSSQFPSSDVLDEDGFGVEPGWGPPVATDLRDMHMLRDGSSLGMWCTEGLACTSPSTRVHQCPETGGQCLLAGRPWPYPVKLQDWP